MEPQSGRHEAGDRPADATMEAESSTKDPGQRADEEYRRAEGYLSLLKRERADFTNYRRRAEQERADQAQLATMDLILSLLPALDDLERALAGMPTEEAEAPWVNGIQLVERSLRSALERAGLERIKTEGAHFDPHVHEAILQEEAPGRPAGAVVREFRSGYRLGDRVLRPAQVSVARGTGPQSS